MGTPLSDLQLLLHAMEPVLQEGVYVFVSLPHGADLTELDALATMREREGLTVVMEARLAEQALAALRTLQHRA